MRTVGGPDGTGVGDGDAFEPMDEPDPLPHAPAAATSAIVTKAEKGFRL
jgi:hypothetical protein